MGRALRGSRELMQWDSSLFITLTLDDKHNDGSLHKKDHPNSITNFIKRLKKRFKSSKLNPIRQIYCGEYGNQTRRPHYHAIIFNCDFIDRSNHYLSEQGHQLYTSPTLNSLWPFGHSEFGYATTATIGYIYKYILKKKSRKERQKPLIINGKQVEHEFIEGSRNPGIGAVARNSTSLIKGFMTSNGTKLSVPKYYLDYLKIHNPSAFQAIQEKNENYFENKTPLTEKELRQKEQYQLLVTDTKRRM